MAVNDYNTTNKFNAIEARRLLIKRIKYLTGNTRLLGVKKEILIGVFFSNQQISDPEKSFNCLDCYFEYTAIKPLDDKLQKRLKHFSFVDGFKEKHFHEFSKSELKQILRVWNK